MTDVPNTMVDTNSTFSPNLVETHELNMRFGTKQVLRDLSVKIRHGQTVAIIGESGCGKTVFLKTLVGLPRYAVEPGSYFKIPHYLTASQLAKIFSSL